MFVNGFESNQGLVLCQKANKNHTSGIFSPFFFWGGGGQIMVQKCFPISILSVCLSCEGFDFSNMIEEAELSLTLYSHPPIDPALCAGMLRSACFVDRPWTFITAIPRYHVCDEWSVARSLFSYPPPPPPPKKKKVLLPSVAPPSKWKYFLTIWCSWHFLPPPLQNSGAATAKSSCSNHKC